MSRSLSALMPCIVLFVTGCAGPSALTQSTGTPALTQRAASPAQEADDVTHPLSYKSIQLAAYSEAEPLVDVGFDRRYDVFCLLFQKTPMVYRMEYRNCKIVGMTGRDRRLTKEFSSFSKSNVSRTHWDPSDLFDNMLVLETEDGRLAYIPPGAIEYIEETDARRQRTDISSGLIPGGHAGGFQ